MVIQDSTDRREATAFRAHFPPQGVCGNLINAFKFLENQQKDGDSPVKMVVHGFPEKKSAQNTSGRAQKGSSW